MLERCTVNGLLAGGLHYKSHRVKPCIHHTFSHAKNLAFVLDNLEGKQSVNKKTPVPRTTNDGVKHFPELDVWLGSRGPWKSTVSTYDQIWKRKYSVPGTGGALSVLWHEKVGPLFTASMAEYIMVEANNQQEQPGIDFCLTPRVERFQDNVWFTNIHDLKSKASFKDENGVIDFKINTNLTNREKEVVSNDAAFQLNYLFDNTKTIIKAKRTSKTENDDTLVLPIISKTGEKVVQLSENTIEIHKENGIFKVTSSIAIKIKQTEKERIFNQVPGMEVLPLLIYFPKGITEISCAIEVV